MFTPARVGPLQTVASENPGSEAPVTWRGRNLFSYLSSCPDAQILFLVPWREKRPLPAPGARLPAHLPGETQGAAFPEGSWRVTHCRAPRGPGRLDFLSISARGRSISGRACRAGDGVGGQRLARQGGGLPATACARPTELVAAAHPPRDGGHVPSPRPASPARRRQAPPQGRAGRGR